MARYSSSIQRVRTDDYGNIAEELPCISCGYNLYSLSTESICPECGVSVGRSVMGDYLRYCNPNWVSKLSIGTNMVVVGILIAVLVGVFAAAAASGGVDGADMVQTIGTLTGSLILMIGYFVLTTPDPVNSSGGTKARFMARWFLLASFVFDIGEVLSAFSNEPRIYLILGSLNAIVSLIGMFALLVYCRQLARRVPDPSLVTHTTIVMWGWVISIAGLFLIGFIAGAGGQGGADAAMGLACMALIFVLVLMIWSLVLTLWYGRAFTNAAREARSGWARQATL